MRDLSEIDRELEALGPEPQDLLALIERYAGQQRLSDLEAVDQLLQALGEGVAGEAAAAATAGSEAAAAGQPGRDTLVDAAAPEADRPGLDEPDLEAETAALLAEEEEAAREPPWASPTAREREEVDGSSLSEADEEQSSSFSREELATMDGDQIAQVLQASSRPPPPDRASEAERALLEQDLDPSDFPQTTPLQQPAAAGFGDQAALPADSDDEEFELLVDDEDIIEIDGEEIELLEDD